MLHYFAPANGRPTACQRSNVRVLETVEYECSGARVLASKSSSVRPSTREYESRDSTLAFKFRVSRTVHVQANVLKSRRQYIHMYMHMYSCSCRTSSCTLCTRGMFAGPLVFIVWEVEPGDESKYMEVACTWTCTCWASESEPT